MAGVPLNPLEIQRIHFLRETGHSISEISQELRRSKTTIFHHIKNISVNAEFVDILRKKQGGSKRTAEKNWKIAHQKAKLLFKDTLSINHKLLLLASIYWGEGNKKELNLINSDPGLIKVFLECLYEIGVKSESVKISLRLYSDIDKNNAIEFWTSYLSLKKSQVYETEIIEGKKLGKLPYGMCRVRIAKSGQYFKLIMCLIEEIRVYFNAAVVQRIEQGTPKP